MICPECRDGKHGNCTGWALDEQADEFGACACEHVGSEVPC